MTPPPEAHRAGSVASGIARAWRNLAPDRRLAAFAAIGLFLTLFLPWYQVTVIATGRQAALQEKSAQLTGWGAFSFVEAAVLLVAAGVLTLLYKRAEGRAFHLPGGDGGVITAAGTWTSLLIVWRIFDKQSTSVTGPGATTSGIEWGIFVALAVAAVLAYAGSRIRAAHQPEPPLPGDDDPGPPARPVANSRRVRPPRPVAADRRASWLTPDDPLVVPEDPPTHRLGSTVVPEDPPTHRLGSTVVPEDPPTHRLRSTGAREDSPTHRLRSTGAPEDPPAHRLGPTVVPEDPPTLRIGRGSPEPSPPGPAPQRRTAADEQLTIPLDDDGFEDL